MRQARAMQGQAGKHHNQKYNILGNIQSRTDSLVSPPAVYQPQTVVQMLMCTRNRCFTSGSPEAEMATADPTHKNRSHGKAISCVIAGRYHRWGSRPPSVAGSVPPRDLILLGLRDSTGSRMGLCSLKHSTRGLLMGLCSLRDCRLCSLQRS